MSSESLVRPAVFSDQRQLSRMLEINLFVHRHLDWREPLSWIGSRPFLVVENQGELIGALACPPDPPGVAWLRLFVMQSVENAEEIWKLLWEAAFNDLRRQEAGTVAAIVLFDQMTPLLKASGFSSHQDLVMLEKNNGELSEVASSRFSLSIRPMVAQDLPSVAVVDTAAFNPLWQNSLPDLTLALSRAILAAVAEVDGRVVGYHISTRNYIGIHLARLAVHPEMQKSGIGQVLVNDLITNAKRLGITRFTVNTQSDNSVSLTIYKKQGFKEIEERYPVYQRKVPN